MFSLAMIPFALQAAPPLHDFFMRELTRSYRITESPSPDAAGCALHVRTGPAIAPAPHDRKISYPQGEGWLTDGRFILQTAQAHIEVQLQPALQVTLVLHQPPNAQTHIEFGYALQALLRYRGRFTAHAAAVIEPITQTGLLLVGASGSGKTTTTLQLVRQGWQYLSDDLLLLGATEQGIAAWGLRRAFAATERTLAACDYVGAQRPQGQRMVGDIEKLAFDPQTLFPQQYAKSCTPQHLLFVESPIRPPANCCRARRAPPCNNCCRNRNGLVLMLIRHSNISIYCSRSASKRRAGRSKPDAIGSNAPTTPRRG
ncbi:MAG: hypothetical protein HOP19_15555 [Acidobacteria bacterium]|nr:hypothetical protein [Acidobacteriota bacterium]